MSTAGAQWREFAATLPFTPDPFQERACLALERGESTLVSAPTGSGKTLVAAFAAHLALAEGSRLFYTTPIKALSNQKYTQLCRQLGASQVGLLTGDTTLNAEAPVVVMTTEVLRNMLYTGSAAIDRLGYVVLDEVHYLADAERGGVWEEVVILTPPRVQFVSLSATVSNVEQFGDWLTTVRGPTEVVYSTVRPVPLWRHVLLQGRMLDLDASSLRLPAAIRRTSRTAAIDTLDREALLPCIYFIFSRDGCEKAVAQLMRSPISLCTEDEATEIELSMLALAGKMSESDQAAVGLASITRAARRGFAAHHAGLLPVVKQHIEDLFAAGLLKVVFATETLALGINMPARSVVLERLIKWNGVAHAPMTPAEFTQLTGRAGRRGIDVEGHAVVLAEPGLDLEHLRQIAAADSFPLNSSFRPTCSMAVGLISTMGAPAAKRILASSFGQFQADQDVVRMERQAAAHREQIARLREQLHCSRGDFAAYAELRLEVSQLEKKVAKERNSARQAKRDLDGLALGTVIRILTGKEAGPAVVVGWGKPGRNGKAAWVVTARGQYRRITPQDAAKGLHVIGEISLPRRFDARQARDRKIVQTQLRQRQASFNQPSGAKRQPDPLVEMLRAQIKEHPCHACPHREEHAALGAQVARLQAEERRMSAAVQVRAGSLARQFDAICALLSHLGYLQHSEEGLQVTAAGAVLRAIYTECDLLVAEAIRTGAWDGLSPAQLAATVSTLVYSGRAQRSEDAPPPAVRQALGKCADLWQDLAAQCARFQVPVMRELDDAGAGPVARWAGGSTLAQALAGTEMTAGDFVRLCMQIADLLRQIRHTAASAALRRTADAALDAVVRGVVGLGGM